MYMTPFVKSLLALLFNAGVIILIAVLAFLLIQWAAVFFAVPGGIIQIVGFLIALYVIYKVAMLFISFIESLKNL